MRQIYHFSLAPLEAWTVIVSVQALFHSNTPARLMALRIAKVLESELGANNGHLEAAAQRGWKRDPRALGDPNSIPMIAFRGRAIELFLSPAQVEDLDTVLKATLEFREFAKSFLGFVAKQVERKLAILTHQELAG